jgi:hypothetical protein
MGGSVPQNFRTRTVHLRRAQSDLIATWPEYTPAGQRSPLFSKGTYRVGDITLADGRQLTGLLIEDDDRLFVHEDEPHFDAVDITSLTATPPDKHPDFTITEPETLLEGMGKVQAIEMGNLWRRDMFGPPKDKRDLRALPVEEAHEEALEDISRIYTYRDGVPACWHGINAVTLVPDGIQVTVRRVQDDEFVTLIFKPTSSDTWREILECHLTVAEGVRVRDLLRLVDLPTDVAREVYHRITSYEGVSFQNWLRALEPTEAPVEMDPELAFIAVYPMAYETDGAYVFELDMSGYGHILPEGSEEYGVAAGERVVFGLGGSALPPLLDIPVHYRDEMVIPVGWEEEAAHQKGPVRDWREGGRIGPMPPYPTIATIRRRVTLRDFLHTFFHELPWMRDPEE